MNNKKGFTLIELLAVIVILALTFLFVIPEMTTIIKKGENTNKTLVEERIINAAKEYASNKNDFFNDMILVGDSKNISKEDLLNSSLITEDDIASLEDFAYVKCEIVENDKIKYTIIYEEKA